MLINYVMLFKIETSQLAVLGCGFHTNIVNKATIKPFGSILV